MTQSSRTRLSNSIPEDDFAVVSDDERRFIVDCGTYAAMVERARHLNNIYQSTAYSAKRWIDGRIW